jgi:hypothetical protein
MYTKRGSWITRPETNGTHPSQRARDIPNVDKPTDAIEFDCPCSWVVIRVKSQNLPALSRLKYPTIICRHHGSMVSG